MNIIVRVEANIDAMEELHTAVNATDGVQTVTATQTMRRIQGGAEGFDAFVDCLHAQEEEHSNYGQFMLSEATADARSALEAALEARQPP